MSIKPYNYVSKRIENSLLVRKISQKIPEALKFTVDKTIFVFECQLPIIIAVASSIFAAIGLGLPIMDSLPWIIPTVLFLIYDMINSSDIYPKNYLKNMTLEAQKGRLKPIILDPDFTREIYVNFLKAECPNVILTGAAGTGKTTEVEGLAQLMVSDRCPLELRGKTLYRLDLKELRACGGHGTSSSLEMRLVMIMDELMHADRPSILFIDEIHTILDRDKGTSLANYLKPDITTTPFNIIGASTLDEYEKYICPDGAIKRRFTPVAMRKLDDKKCVEMIRTKYSEAQLPEDVATLAMLEADKVSGIQARPHSVVDMIENARVHKADRRAPITQKDVEDAVVRWHVNNKINETPAVDVPQKVNNISSNIEKITRYVSGIHKSQRKKFRVVHTKVVKAANRMRKGVAMALATA
jgi:hypothetical protein